MFDALKNLKDKAEDIAEEHGDKIADGLEKVGDFIDERTEGKHSRRSPRPPDCRRRPVTRRHPPVSGSLP
ncbi:antitoxin [Streptomyces roseochromogenus]|uniref:Antitoxin n=1 Tax=Streptomyces roseochromogenus subsp. oscitans DS 12.976 TaxID=1352936 RepID=V6JID0_STRRC|nr:antitoxin [Streptomyces roseochromogenus]EST19463.1 hypothetical protein M878_42145 [Streptomyces roseochromogenus subsp. oscitans DS 12.976]